MIFWNNVYMCQNWTKDHFYSVKESLKSIRRSHGTFYTIEAFLLKLITVFFFLNEKSLMIFFQEKKKSPEQK